MPSLHSDGYEAAKFLRHNKTCSGYKREGCSHPACHAAAHFAAVVESLIEENKSLQAPQIKVAA